MDKLNEKYNENMESSIEDEKIQKDDLEKDTGKDATADQQAEPEYPDLFKAVLIVVSLFITVFLVALDQTIIGTAIPKITDQFHSVQDVGWYGSAYFLTSTALQPTYGRIYKIMNVSRVPFKPWKVLLPFKCSHARSGQMGFPCRHFCV